MSITLNDLAGNSTPEKENLKRVSIDDIPTEAPKPDEGMTASYLQDQFGALDGLVGQAKSAREKFDENHADEDISANLDDFDPDVLDGPVLAAANTKDGKTNDTTVEYLESNVEETNGTPIPDHPTEDIDPGNYAEESTPLEVVKDETSSSDDKRTEKEIKKEENEFNHIFDDEEEDERAEMLKILNDEDTSSDDDDDDDTPAELSEDEQKVIVDRYKEDVTKFYSGKRTSVNTSEFKVSNKSITMSNLLKIKEPAKRVADWVQTTAKKPFSTVEYTGLELLKVNPNNANRNRNSINAKKEIYRAMYNHIVGSTKDGFENWLRTTPYSDIAQYYFGIYLATFGDMNVVTYQCTNNKCNNVFIEEKPVSDMYEVDKDFKEEFDRIYNGDTSFVTECKEEIIPVSDVFAIGWMNDPSIYSIEIEPLLISEDDQTKFSKIINLIPFINKMYYIDSVNHEYVPIDESPVPKDIAKTVKHKLATYYNILMSLSNDQLAAPQLRVYNYTERQDKIKFFEPECKCPKCGKVIEKQQTNAATLLFNRAQSPLAANS